MEKTWIRNPSRFAGELAEVGHLNVTWNLGLLYKTKTNPQAFGNLYWGTNSGWEAIVIGNTGAVHIDAEHGTDDPKAVYPVWTYGDEWDVLEEMAYSPIGLDYDACTDERIDKGFRPVIGQEHVIFICDLPAFSTGVGRSIIRRLSEFQDDYPEATVFIDASHSYSVQFGMNFKASNNDPLQLAQRGAVMLPSGKQVKKDNLVRHAKWVHLLNMAVPDLNDLSKRIIFNVKSALWARDNYQKDLVFKTKGATQVVDERATEHVAETTQNHNLPAPIAGDKIACDSCSLNLACKFYRKGSVCTLPSSEASKLAKMFQTRDAEMIVDGLGQLVGLQVERVQKGMAQEDVLGDLDPEVGKQLNAVIDNGIKLAKIVDPSRAGGTQVQVNVGGGGSAQVVQAATPNQVMAEVIRTIQATTGLSRNQITQEMIMNTLQGMYAKGQQPQITQGQVVPNA